MNYVSDYAEKELTQFDTKWREWAFKNKTVGVKVEIQKCDRGGSFEHGSVMTRW